MRRPHTTLRFLAGLLAPGGVLVLATWAVQREDVMRQAASPYAAYFCFGALVAAVLLSWYYDQSRLLCSASAVVLTVLALRDAGNRLQHGAARRRDFASPQLRLLAVVKERGVMTLDGLLKVGIVAAQAAGVLVLGSPNEDFG